MVTRRVGAACVLILAVGLVGCGSGGGPSPGCKTVTFGALQVGVESAASFRVLTLNSPGASRIAFTALYGSRIVSLREMGYGRLVVRGYDGHDSELYLMNSDGSDLVQITDNEVMDWHPTWSPDGLVSATTIGVAERNWSTPEVAALRNIGADLAGVKIVGNNIRQVIEDRGRVLLRGTFTEAYGARHPRRNLATATAHEIALDARTGEVTAVH